MALADALVVAAHSDPVDVHRRLGRLDGTSLVVVRREHEGHTYYYVFRAGQVLAATGPGTGATLTEALNLHEWQATPQADAHHAPRAEDVRGPVVLLDGDVVLGVVLPDAAGGTRGDGAGGTRGDAAGGTRGDAAGGTGGAVRGGGTGRTPPGDEFESFGPAEGRRDVQPGAEGEAGAGGEPEVEREPEAAAPEREIFRGFPRVEAPAAVAAGLAFDVGIGFARHGSPRDTPVMVAIPTGPPSEPVAFVVQVMGHGFDFPSGVRAELLVPPSNIDGATATITAVAQPVTTDVVRVLEVSYEFEGNVVGRAWREVRVGAQEAPIPTEATLFGGTGVAPPPGEPAPHLSVEIRSRQGDAELEWLLHTRYADLPRPDHRLVTELGEGSAKEFAIQVMGQLPAQQGSPFLGKTVVGIGRRVAAAMPSEVWTLLAQVWERARQEGDVPSLLLVTNEPYVPWELAWVDEDYVDPALLPTPASGESPGQTLGSLWRVGRWVPPIARTPRGGDRPAMPPSTRVDVSSMAVVIGDYASDTSLRPLPEAVEEGKEIALAYRGYPLKADEADINRLLGNDLSRDDKPFQPGAVHIAAHGEVSPQMQQYSGIILSQSQRRLDPLVVQGSALTRETKPFVFLNACQVGTAGAFLNEYGGMPGAFLSEGCRGYVAPLWNVDDLVAHRFAVEFYDSAIAGGTPVAECLRVLRNRFGTQWAGQTATPLAYVFYGHPSLVLTRSGTADGATTAGVTTAGVTTAGVTTATGEHDGES